MTSVTLTINGHPIAYFTTAGSPTAKPPQVTHSAPVERTPSADQHHFTPQSTVVNRTTPSSSPNPPPQSTPAAQTGLFPGSGLGPAFSVGATSANRGQSLNITA